MLLILWCNLHQVNKYDILLVQLRKIKGLMLKERCNNTKTLIFFFPFQTIMTKLRLDI